MCGVHRIFTYSESDMPTMNVYDLQMSLGV